MSTEIANSSLVLSAVGQNDLLTVKQASQRLQVSPSLMYALCAAGEIDHHRCGLGRGTIRIHKDALRAYLEWSKHTVHLRPQGGGKNFSHLNSARLAEAWRRQGAL